MPINIKQKKLMKLTIAICTFNRVELLKKCLYSIITLLDDEIEVLVIDNKSTDTTKNQILHISNQFRQFKYIYEDKIGLSIARNRAISESTSDWILFLDDDTIASENLIKRVKYLIDLNSYDCIGGSSYGVTDIKLPKWLGEGYGSRMENFKTLSHCHYTIPHGYLILYRKSILQELGGFSTKLGMRGSEIAYGEESEMNQRISLINGKIGYDPELIVGHYIRVEKTSLFWHIKSAIAKGRDSAECTKVTFLTELKLILRTILSLLIKRTIPSLFQLIFNKNYYYQNFILDCFRPSLILTGRLYAILLNPNHIRFNDK
jgi:glucosyl-dolichyl phosphate glucuronosyltransferase